MCTSVIFFNVRITKVELFGLRVHLQLYLVLLKGLQRVHVKIHSNKEFIGCFLSHILVSSCYFANQTGLKWYLEIFYLIFLITSKDTYLLHI